MDPFAWLILVFAISAAGDSWHWGSIFSNWRAWVEAHRPVWWSELLSCPFCLSHWLAALAVLISNQPLSWGWSIIFWLSLVKGVSLVRTHLPIDVMYPPETDRE
jgi:hypothetical protein